jgi:hypothetical protein
MTRCEKYSDGLTPNGTHPSEGKWRPNTFFTLKSKIISVPATYTGMLNNKKAKPFAA